MCCKITFLTDQKKKSISTLKLNTLLHSTKIKINTQSCYVMDISIYNF